MRGVHVFDHCAGLHLTMLFTWSQKRFLTQLNDTLMADQPVWPKKVGGMSFFCCELTSHGW